MMKPKSTKDLQEKTGNGDILSLEKRIFFRKLIFI